MNKETILIDCDQCLLNFNQRVADIHYELFGFYPKIKDGKAFKAANVYDFSGLSLIDQGLLKLKTTGENMWSKMKPMDGALEFVNSLSEHFNFIVFTSMQPIYEKIRMQNLIELGFKIEKVIAVPGSKTHNPKEDYARETNAVFFIDDLAKNFKGIHDIPTELILLDHNYSDGANTDLEGIHIDHIRYSLSDIKEDIILPHLSR